MLLEFPPLQGRPRPAGLEPHRHLGRRLARESAERFESVTDAHGATVSGYTATSDSGTDWSKPVSEPEPPAATLSAAAAIAALARRRASRALATR